MRKKSSVKGKLIGVTAVALIVFCGSSYWSGDWVEQGFMDGVAKANAYGFTVNVTEYVRSIFGATARTEMIFPASDGGDPVAISFTHDIRHGWLPGLTAAAHIRSEAILPGDVVTRINETFGGDPFEGRALFAVDSEIGWGGGQHHRLVSPGFEAARKDGTKVTWSGLDGEIFVNAAQSKTGPEVVINGMSLSRGEESKFQSGQITFKGDAAKPDTYELVLDRIELRSKDEIGVLRGVDLEKLRAVGSMNIDDGVLNAEVMLSVPGVLVKGELDEKIENPKGTFVYENVDVAALVRGVLMYTLSQDDDEEQDKDKNDVAREVEPPRDRLALVQEGEEELVVAPLVRREPVLTIKDASGQWPEGEVSGSFRLGYTGKNGDDEIMADLQLDLPRDLVVRVVKMDETTKASAGADDAEDDEGSEADNKVEIEKVTGQRIVSMVKDGLLIEKEGGFSVKASFRNNEQSFNGKPVPFEKSMRELLPLVTLMGLPPPEALLGLLPPP